jgi:hypothetical protein
VSSVVTHRLTFHGAKRRLLSVEKQKKVQIQIRMDPRMRRRVREYIKKVERESGVEIGFSEAVRSLLERSLERMEGK